MNTATASRLINLAVLFLLGFFLVGTSGFDLIPDAGVFNGKRIIEVFVLLAILLLVLGNRNLRTAYSLQQRVLPGWALIFLLIALCFGVASALRFEQPAYGLLELALPVMLILGTLATAATRRLAGEDFDRMAMLIIIALGFIVVVTELMGIAVAWSLGLEFSFERMLIRFSHPRFYNQLQTFSIPLIATLPLLFSARKHMKSLAIFLLGLQWCLVLISGGRGTVVSVLVSLTVTAFIFPTVRGAWSRTHLAGIVLGAILFVGLNFTQQSVAPGEGEFIKGSVGRQLLNSTGRNGMWAVAMEQAKQNPLLGSGPSRFACESPASMPSHPHNFVMRILSEMGFPATILILLVCAWLGWSLIRNSRNKVSSNEPQPVLTTMLFCSVLAGAIHAGVSGVLIMPASQMMTLLVCGWCLGRFDLANRERSSFGIPAVVVLSAGVLLAAATATFSTIELQQMNIRTQDLRAKNLFMPRYWHFGRSCNYMNENN